MLQTIKRKLHYFDFFRRSQVRRHCQDGLVQLSFCCGFVVQLVVQQIHNKPTANRSNGVWA